MFNLSWKDVDLQTECKIFVQQRLEMFSSRILMFSNYILSLLILPTPKNQLKNINNYDFKPEILKADEAKAISTGLLQNANYLNNGNALIKKIVVLQLITTHLPLLIVMFDLRGFKMALSILRGTNKSSSSNADMFVFILKFKYVFT
ncbi:hypothetical protein BpHYR1_009391 [Brachionus plicatilis]|uniref:Uncharacterized protein n=1 Tax=Brachionus plicatilis TaxID=10195 RepID=A0A3M7RTE0_BRAPC|nr:hypothetical protein BpHYR1_009391 [Brachionus plicatilis]